MIKEVLLENTNGKINHEGTPIRGIGYFSNDTNKRMMTIDIHVLNFTGRIYLYGSLSKNPKNDNDWFEIKLSNDTNYLEYDNIKIGNTKVFQETKMFNIYGSYTWLKAKMDRSYIPVIETPVSPFYPNVITHANIAPYTSTSTRELKNNLDNKTTIYPLDKLGIIEYINLCY